MGRNSLELFSSIANALPNQNDQYKHRGRAQRLHQLPQTEGGIMSLPLGSSRVWRQVEGSMGCPMSIPPMPNLFFRPSSFSNPIGRGGSGQNRPRAPTGPLTRVYGHGQGFAVPSDRYCSNQRVRRPTCSVAVFFRLAGAVALVVERMKVEGGRAAGFAPTNQ